MTSASAEDRALIRDSARGFLADHSTSARVRDWMATPLGYDPALWQQVAGELGWPGVPLAEDHGGLGLGWGEVALLMEEMGESLFCSPFFSTVCLAATAIRNCGSSAQQDEWLSAIASGTLTATLAVSEPGDAFGPSAIALEASRDGDSFVLNGTKRFVVDGASADLLIVAARKPGTTGERGISLFGVPGNADGVVRETLTTLDQTRRLAAITFANVRVPASGLLGEEGGAWAGLSRSLDLAGVALAAEQAGGARKILQLTTDYLKERVQFGRVLGSFQALKHRCADMAIKVESALNAARYAADAADADDPEFPLLASMAKAYCSEAFFACAGESIQLHGGVGFTWEYDPHLYFKRARAGMDLLGSPQAHRERIAAGIGL